MIVDHIFIFTNDKENVADQLVEFGFVEGSNRIHNGQGTANRKFYFDNFFLEVLWVHNENQIKCEPVRSTELWQRSDFLKSGFSRFGLCLVNTEDTNKAFENAFKYQPAYFPKGMFIDVIKNETQRTLPWTFRLPFKGQRKNETEPTNHSNQISSLTKATFEYSGHAHDKFTTLLNQSEQLNFKESDRDWLTLSFDNGNQKKNQDFEALSLTIKC